MLTQIVDALGPSAPGRNSEAYSAKSSLVGAIRFAIAPYD